MPRRAKSLTTLPARTAYEGRLVVLGEPSVGVGDCRIEWADGGINRDAGAADGAIGEAVARYISARRSFAAAT